MGELGWELHVPNANAAALYHRLTAAGASHGLRHGGYRAILESLRIEKGFVHFGHDVSPKENPFEAGLGFAVKGDLVNRVQRGEETGGGATGATRETEGDSVVGSDFLGRAALVKHLTEGGPTQRLVSFAVVDDGASGGHHNGHGNGTNSDGNGNNGDGDGDGNNSNNDDGDSDGGDSDGGRVSRVSACRRRPCAS